MKKAFLLFVLLVTVQLVSAQSEAQHTFIHSFLENVTQHQDQAIINQMEKSYRKEQLKFLGGNTAQFLNELLSGTDINSGEWTNIQFDDILRIEVAEVVEQADGNFEYIFRIRTESADLLCSLLLHVGKRFGFEGARG